MRLFYDDQDRQWRLSINVATVKRVRRVFSEEGEPFDLLDADLPIKLANDPALLADLLWELVDKSQHPDVTPEQFGEALGGDAIERASDAFVEELFDFFPKGRRDLNRVIYRKIKKTQVALIEKTVKDIENSTSSEDVTNYPELLE
jgi:hypothetical protein